MYWDTQGLKKKKKSWGLTARNKAELLMLEGRCVECSRWKKREEMWKITYYAQFRKWLDSCSLLPPLSLHLSKQCHSNKILFSPYEFTHFGNQQITVLLHIFHSTHAAQPVCSVLVLFVPSFAFALVKALISFCADGLMGDQRVCWFIHLCQ